MLTVLNPVEYYTNHSSILLWHQSILGSEAIWFFQEVEGQWFCSHTMGLTHEHSSMSLVHCSLQQCKLCILGFHVHNCVMVFVCPISASSDTFQSKNAQPFTTKLVFHEMFWLQFPHQDGFSQVCMWLVQTFLYLNGGEFGTNISSSAYTLKCLKWLNKD